MSSFKKIRQKTEEEYKMIGSVFSPALKAEVYFNSDGFHHLRYDGHRSERSKKVQQNKFRFLPQAVEIIKKSTTIQEYRTGLCPVGKANSSGFRKTAKVE